MRRILFPLTAVFAFAPVVRADDAADAKAIIEKAIKARGGKPDTKFTAMTWKDKGTLSGAGAPAPYTAEWSFQAPDKYRFVFQADLGGAKFETTIVVNGEKGWEVDGGKVLAVTGDRLAGLQHDAHQMWVMSLTPLLTEKVFTLATAKEKDVDGKPASAVTVTRDKMPVMTLYFDKGSGLLVKWEMTRKDGLKKDVNHEAYFSDYKDIGGVKRFTKMKLVRAGEPLLEATLTDAKEFEKLDEKLFEKP